MKTYKREKEGRNVNLKERPPYNATSPLYVHGSYDLHDYTEDL